MPAVSKAQQRLMGAAEHGADFPAAQKLRDSMSHQQLHDFASGSEAGKPEHVAPKPPMIAGSAPSVVGSNTNTLKQRGLSELDATRQAIAASKQGGKAKGHPNRHKNLGKFLHPKKS